MNENLDLTQLLAGHEGETFWSPIVGECVLDLITHQNCDYPIQLNYKKNNETYKYNICFTKQGKYLIETNGECLLFPSKEQRNWRVWEMEQNNKKFKFGNIYFIKSPTSKVFEPVLLESSSIGNINGSNRSTYIVVTSNKNRIGVEKLYTIDYVTNSIIFGLS
jgi:hypothetical protein